MVTLRDNRNPDLIALRDARNVYLRGSSIVHGGSILLKGGVTVNSGAWTFINSLGTWIEK